MAGRCDKIWEVPNIGVFFVDAKEGLVKGLRTENRPKTLFWGIVLAVGPSKRCAAPQKVVFRRQNPVLPHK